MSTHPFLPALALAVALTGCDGGVTDASFQHLTLLSQSATYTCGLDGGGRAYCWGDNSIGQLGTGDNRASSSPVPVQTGLRFTQLITGASHTCALATDGRAFCWGDNFQSQLGIASGDLSCELLQANGWLQDFGNICSTLPVAVQTHLRFRQLGTDGLATCGLTGDGQLWCWGNGLLGDSAGISRSDTLVRVSVSAKLTTFTMGPNHVCAADSDGLGWCWGADVHGALGVGVAMSTIGYATAPVRINSSAFLTGFGLGEWHSCAVTGAGDLLCWGNGGSGQRGDSSVVATQEDPTFVLTDRKFRSVAAAGNSTCAIEAGTGAAWCWGENSSGGLGDGTASDRLAPAPVLGSLRFDRLFMKREGYPLTSTTCGASSGAMYCWGVLPEPLTFEE